MTRSRKHLPHSEVINHFLQAAVEGGDDDSLTHVDRSTLSLFTRIFFLARLESAFYDVALKDTERNVIEHYVLSRLRMLGPQTATEINVTLMQTSGGITNTINRLDQAGLVKRVPSAEDRRKTLIHLTAKGRREADKTRALVEALASKKIQSLKESDRDQISEALDKLIAILAD